MGKVIGVVVTCHVIDHHRGIPVTGDVLQVIDQEGAGITFRQVVVVFPALNIFDFKSHDVIGGTAVTDDGGVGLTDINPGVTGTDGFAAFDQNVF